jgi:hypothetical protein
MMLKKRRDRFYGGYTLRGELDHTANTWLWAVYPQDEAP